VHKRKASDAAGFSTGKQLKMVAESDAVKKVTLVQVQVQPQKKRNLLFSREKVGREGTGGRRQSGEWRLTHEGSETMP